MNAGWETVAGGWITGDQLGRVCDLSCRKVSHFAMWHRESTNDIWLPVTTLMGKVTHRRTLQAAMIEVERVLAFECRREAA